MAEAAKVHVYKGKDGRWYWRAKSANYKIVGASEQGYRFRWYAIKKAKAANIGCAIVVELPT